MFIALAIAFLGSLGSPPPQIDSIVLPFEPGFDSDWSVVFGIGINSAGEFPCLFDTGSEFVLPPAFANDLGISKQDPVSLSVSGGGAAQASMISFDLDLAGVPFYGIRAAEAPLPEWTPFRCVGGTPLLRTGTVRLDFDKRQLVLVRSDAFEYMGNAIAIPMRSTSYGSPWIEATVDGFSGHFILDTGAISTIISLNPAFVSKHGLAARYGRGIHRLAADLTGSVDQVAVRAGHLRVGATTFDQPVATLIGKNIPEVDGSIGLRLLRRFNIVFDGARERVYLEPRGNVAEPFVFNRTGVTLDPLSKQPLIAEVVPGSPGEESGLAKGDVILKIDGVPTVPADHLRLSALGVRPVGTKMEFVVQRGTDQKTIQITLRDIL